MPRSDLDTALDGARAGDLDALGQLWEALQPPLLRYLRGRNPAAAEDLASQVWLDAARGLNRFCGDSDAFRRWLFTIARRRVLDELRRASRRPATLTATPPERPAPGGETLVDDLDWALRLVRRLPPDQADAVLLRVVGELDVAHIAAVMGRSQGAVRVLTHRGLRRLARLASPRDGKSGPEATRTPQAAMWELR